MNSDKPLKSRKLPFYGKPSLRNSIKTSSKIRKTNFISFFVKKIWNHLLLTLAYSCPINGCRIILHRMRGVKIGEGVFIGLYVILDRAYPEYITLEDGVMLAGGNHLLCHSRAPEYYKGKLLSYVAPITLKENVWVGINAIILPNVTIGEGSVITAGSVVSDNIPSHSIARGNPAKVFRKFNN